MLSHSPEILENKLETEVCVRGFLAGSAVESKPVPAVDPENMESIVSLSKLTFESAAVHLGKAYQRSDEVLATKISIAVIMSYPLLTAGRMQHALFTKRMFMEGEYDFAQYIDKMQNLFPTRMEMLPQSLQDSIQQSLKGTLQS